jgi:hypothetical protein
MRRKRGANKERGVALFMVVFALLLLTSIALGMIALSDIETTVNSNYRTSVQAFYGARAGVQEGVDRLREGITLQGGAAYSIARPNVMPITTSATGVTYILNPTGGEAVAPWDAGNQYFDLELCNERFVNGTTNRLGIAPAGNGIRCGTAPAGTYYTTAASMDPGTGTSAAMPYKWVRITMKQNGTSLGYAVNNASLPESKICWTGQREVTLASLVGYTDCGLPPVGGDVYTNVYVVTALARTPGQNGSRRLFQAEYAPSPPLDINSAISSKAGVNLTGNLQVNGYDQCTCQQVGSNYGVARYSGGTCDNSANAIYSAQNVDNPNPSQTVVAGSTAIIESIGQNNWPASLEVPPLIDRFKPSSVNVATCSSGSCSLISGTNVMGPILTLPAPDPAAVTASGQVSYIGGNITLNGGGGAGILIVDGDLTIHGGGFQWYGLILVRGVVTFQGGGSANTNIYGAVISGEQTNANTDTTLGGSVNILLDKCAIANSMKGQPLTYISSRELLY